MDTNEEALKDIRRFVWAGFDEPERIVEILCEEVFEPCELDEDWVWAQVENELARKHAEELTWTLPTDCDLIDQTFAELNEKHIIAEQNTGYEQSDGIATISEIWQQAGAESSDIIGYCFYHGQDLERAVSGHGLLLTFGDIHGTERAGILVGERIAQVFEKHGFRVDWDGTIQTRINLPDVRWKKRSVTEAS